MKKYLIIGLVASIAIALVYLFSKSMTGGTKGLSIAGKTPIYPRGSPSFAWTPNSIGAVGGNPVPLSPSSGVMLPGVIRPVSTIAPSPSPVPVAGTPTLDYTNVTQYPSLLGPSGPTGTDPYSTYVPYDGTLIDVSNQYSGAENIG